jgi:hypothetical protein
VAEKSGFLPYFLATVRAQASRSVQMEVLESVAPFLTRRRTFNRGLRESIHFNKRFPPAIASTAPAMRI